MFREKSIRTEAFIKQLKESIILQVLIVLFSVAGNFAEGQMSFDTPPSSSKNIHLVSPKKNNILEKHKWRRYAAENHRFIDAEPECRKMENCGFGMVCSNGECVGIIF